ncbi:MAG: hypothetical protein AB7U29_01750 [Desulfobulbus sp.]
MQNIFLYANKDSSSLHRVEEYLRQIPLAVRFVILPPGTEFTSPASLNMRSNDLLVLFAEDDSDIEQLITLRGEYESFRIILILERHNTLTSNRYINLSPRLVAYLESDLIGVSEYLTNICLK